MLKTFCRKVFLIVAALLSTMSFCYLNSIYSDVHYISHVFIKVIVFTGILFMYIFMKRERKASTVILSLILSFLLLLGKYLVYIMESDGIELWLKMIVTPIGSFIFFDRFFPYLFERLEGREAPEKRQVSLTLIFFGSLVFILAAWIPAWLAEYPGIITPDTLNQLYQTEGIIAYSNANPFIHTIIIKGLYMLISLFTKDRMTIYFVIGLLQMVFTTFVFAFAVTFIYERTNSLILAIGSILFFALASFNVFYNVTISKDTVYAAFTLLFLIAIDNYCNAPVKRNARAFIFCGVMYCLMRENGFYSLVFTFILLLLMAIRRNFKRTVVLFLVTLVLVGAVKYPLYSVVISFLNNAKSASVLKVADYIDINDDFLKRDLYEVRYRRGEDTAADKDYFRGNFLYVMAFQQVGNVVVHDRPLTEKEEWMIEELIPISVIKKVYDPMFVDPMFEYASKYGTPKAIELGVVEYLKLWAGLMVRYPQDYVEAYVNMTRYYFYPNRYVNMYYIGVADNQLGLKQENIISAEFKESVESFYASQKDIPLAASIYSPGTVTFIMITAIFYLMRKTNKTPLLTMLPLLGNFLILMACVPINDEFRYIYPMVVCLPFMLMQFIAKEDKYDFDIEGGNKKWI